ncbi:hypothetical protein M413DRAFT_442720 [Hebeloma cylindrosporum]|uniref:Uncharacterized protein n=1 Tax=Hebeloma cylindrosporum TaxID=76867 RepID=A0A0C2YUT0_HEBCY|nr:hypothetical protein M413DRAFT_442720 [Hebeloma cylindrosporum h7]
MLSRHEPLTDEVCPSPGARNTLGILSEGHGAKVCGSHDEFHLRADRPDVLGVSLLSTSPPGISEGQVDNECFLSGDWNGLYTAERH